MAGAQYGKLDVRVLLVLLLGLSACESSTTLRPQIDAAALEREQHIQRVIAVDQNVRDDARLQDVSFRLLRAAAPDFCRRRTVLSVGMQVSTAYDFDREFQDAAREALAIDETATVVSVVSGGPADVAGIQAGDEIVAINGNPLVEGTNASAIYRNLLRSEMRASQALQLSVRRDSAQAEFTVQPLTICDYPVAMLVSDNLNAYADGESIYVTRRMLRFAEQDEELSLVIAHEIAHNAMDHVAKIQQNSTLGSLVDLAVQSQGFDTNGFFGRLTAGVYSQDFEAEADYVGMYILARAGVNLDGAAYFWRRMAIENPGNIDSSHSSSHPATAERFLALENTILEVAKKQAAQQALDPQIRE